MDPLDKEMESRVWARVLGESPGEAGGEGRLIYLEAEAENAYRSMARKFPDRADACRRMASEARRHGDMLRGICRIQDHPCSLGALPTTGGRESDAAALRKCYHRALLLASEYERREKDREFGCAYARMHEHQRAHLAQLLEMIGSRNLNGK